ncbi:MAG: EF-hand domain-containing protein [Nostoc sp. DedVER02]|uniref:EF-hand domain-containing protein n=1 Tax=unclassified Nostoc TaxID=2593658 RepID=UPI002AD2D3A8|nr:MULTISPECIES: EF-hand domain-containing protein [unclassified Nostoc]MDZ7989207.1 EF-hand domain-containing protein [Nostoc sp. DedVER02]MDZ8113008.1 EF-hand domain-containing protein [Nostoc sp. DedVER01b]
MIDEQEIGKLWQAFKVLDVDGNGSISTDELGEVMRSLGQNPTEAGLRDLIKEIDVDLSGTIDFEEFKTLMVAKVGDRESRLKLAFSAFDEDNSGQITTVELRKVMSQFGLTDAELKEMLQEVDHDGDGSIDFHEFCQLVPESESKTGYKDSPISLNSSLKTVSTNTTGVVATTEPNLQEASSSTTPELAQLKEQLAQHPNSPNQKKSGTSRLQMQIGLFRLIQGAAYRCFRESFSANHETHLRVKNLPYRITDFVEFVKQAIALYKGLGVVEEACYPVLDAVVESIADEYARLQDRIKNWKTVAKTPEMLAEEKAILEARSKFANVKEKFAAGVEFAITIKKKSLSLGDIVEGVLAINELNRLRAIEMNEEMAPPPPESQGNPKDYLKKWNRVILSQATEEVDGAMMPVAYWYEDFMPKLLAAFSVSTAADIQSNTIPDEAALNEWYDCTKKSGEFNRYGADVAENFLHCTPKEKLVLKQAWRLTHYYLNGVQKRRERLEFGRESGALSQYVSFIDVYLNRTEVKDSQMRVSFPYYIGPAVWRFFHTTAEIVATKTSEQQKALIAIFKDFFQLFATMYPCPYCRHHLNMYVVQNKEIDMYPVEYLVLGRDPNLSDFEVSLEAKLSTVVDGSSLRLFFWKLHNTVSSSIARSEEWYHKDEKAFYTTRFWPSLDSELARANALKYTSIETARIYNIYGMLKPLARLAGVKTELPKLLQKGDTNNLKEACIVAQNHIRDLEEAIIRGEFLQETYYFEPELADKAPIFTPEEEEFARTGMFTETA